MKSESVRSAQVKEEVSHRWTHHQLFIQPHIHYNWVKSPHKPTGPPSHSFFSLPQVTTCSSNVTLPSVTHSNTHDHIWTIEKKSKGATYNIHKLLMLTFHFQINYWWWPPYDFHTHPLQESLFLQLVWPRLSLVTPVACCLASYMWQFVTTWLIIIHCLYDSWHKSARATFSS